MDRNEWIATVLIILMIVVGSVASHPLGFNLNLGALR